MLLNTSELFVCQCAKHEFLDTLEDVLNSRRTSSVVCERLLDVLAGAAYASSRTPYKNVSGFGMLWREVKPAGWPDEVGIYLLYPSYVESGEFITGYALKS
jgi:hypothetical protein